MNTSEVKVGSTIAQQFSRSAASYRKESRVQMFLEQEVLARVICHSSGMPNGVKFLDLGSGTGSLAAAIAKSHPASQIDAVDIADKMIQLAKNEYSESKNIYWHCVDFRQAALAGKYDMICSNATLQWIMPLEHTFTKIRSLLAKNGRLVFSIILKGSLQEITQARDLAAPHKTPIVRLPSMDEVFAAVGSSGFCVDAARFQTHTLEFKSAKEVFEHLRKTGVNGANSSAATQRLTHTETKRMIANYESRGGKQNNPLSFRTLIVEASAS